MIRNNPIAVVGMAGLFPGSFDLDGFWQNIINKVDTADEVRPGRWNLDPDSMCASGLRPDKAYSRRCCHLTDFEFDPSGFNIDQTVIADLDPLYHIVLHVGRQALAGIPKSSLNRQRTGVVLAAIALPTDTTSEITSEILGSAFEGKVFADIAAVRNVPAIKTLSRSRYLAGRVTSLPGAILAKAFGLGGGTYTLDAACASSLYAVKLACDQLHTRRADAVLAGGVSRPNSLFTQVGFSQLRALSPSGRCAPFDESADGLVVGEGAGMVVLKRLEDALRDQDPVYGLIHAVGLSNDMRGNLLAPDSEGQLRAMRSAYETCGWSPHDIDLIECHGAGTPLGDLTELNSLTKLWGTSGWKRRQCSIGSVKSMIGHLLTAAGAAGMIKTLLALRNKSLPPSLNFKRAPQNSPLEDGPFRVQTESESWPQRNDHQPRRAAVSAFGFGGINAHMLLEEYDEKASGDGLKIDPKKPATGTSGLSARQYESSEETTGTFAHSAFRIPNSPIAIVGMGAFFGSSTTLRQFQELIFRGDSNIKKRPSERWKGCDHVAYQYLKNQSLNGGFCDALSIGPHEFHIPPKDIPDILPQQLLMLKVAAAAIQDAGLPLRTERPAMGTIIGIDFDMEAANFHLRWHLAQLFDGWMKKYDLHPSEPEKNTWLEAFKDAYTPPLTATRTLGALGGIVASRVAREFRFGGPSFVVSCEEAGGLKALEIGVRALQQNEANAFLIGAVDLNCDVRNIILKNCAGAFSKNPHIRPFDQAADGTLPGEGAAAMIIKRLDRALADGDRIYSVIKGCGSASGGGIDLETPTADAYVRSLRNCFQDAEVAPENISLLETHGSGHPVEDDLESTALHEFFSRRQTPCAIGSVKANIGHTGAASALAAIVKVSLSLYHEILPPLANFTTPQNPLWFKGSFHFPLQPQYWLRDRDAGARQAVVGTMTPDGNCMHVLLAGCDDAAGKPQPAVQQKITHEKKRPLGLHAFGLFGVEGRNRQELLAGLDDLNQHIENFLTANGAVQGSDKPQNIEAAAQSWYLKNDLNPELKSAISLAAADFKSLKNWIGDAREAILSDTPQKMGVAGGIRYSPHPLGSEGDLAFVFPGSGNHYVGMGRDIAVHWPHILCAMDRQTARLKSQLLPECYVPWRVSWSPGWQKEAYDKIISDPLHMIFGQVVHGGVMANLIKYFKIQPSAVIGYSLGETAGYFAMDVWPERGEMLKKMQTTNLFTTELAGPCNAARRVWAIAADEEVNWRVAVVNRSAKAVGQILDHYATLRLLIVNTPEECVVGGRLPDVNAAVRDLNCEAIFLDGVVTVHCDALKPVADEYRDLHVFPTHPPEGIRFYSCALARAYEVTSDKAANSILNQALHGFDFTATINRAYQDGVRLFLELGPYSSCTRMIHRILQNKPHLAVSACVQGEEDHITILKLLGTLIAERVPVNLAKLYGRNAYPPALTAPVSTASPEQIKVEVGGKAPCPSLPHAEDGNQRTEVRRQPTEDGGQKTEDRGQRTENRGEKTEERSQGIEGKEQAMAAGTQQPENRHPFSELMESANQIAQRTADAHQKFLELSNEITRSYAETFNLQTKLLERILKDPEDSIPALEEKRPEFLIQPSEFDSPEPGIQPSTLRLPHSKLAFSREACLEFATGSVAEVLGSEFAIVDTYSARVRLPDEPLMLVDRIISVDGQKGSLGPGRIVTEHDVLPGAWYLDGGHAPVCISVEAGQADLFLCAYLGIDLKVQGRRTYRLLDATVAFHRELPVPGETIRYEIEIDKFLRQGETYLFLFHFKGFIGNMPLITMTDGCAGFFTEEEVKNSGGIILTAEDAQVIAGKKPSDWQDLVSMRPAGYPDTLIRALRSGNLRECFGEEFNGVTLPETLRLPGGRMQLIDRVVNLDPAGGRFGIGSIQAEADIHPDDWFLICHFVDDMVMPGTLMYECCAHTLRVFLQRIGWVTEKQGVFYEPVTGVEATLKCRGPVTPQTKKVLYEIEIKELGYRPQPYVIADAYMYADGRRIVCFRDMSMQMSGITRDEIESFWQRRGAPLVAKSSGSPKTALFDRSHMLAFADGRPSKVFGAPYEPFDTRRFIARLPRPPYLMIDRVLSAEPEPWVLKPDGWIEAECDVHPEAWYFRAEKSPAMPISILLEIALQPCGWLAAYMGSALRSQKDLRFRNLGGTANLHSEVLLDAGTLTIKSRLTNASEAADMIIEHFDFEIRRQDQKIYTGNTYFGFFTKEALEQQDGIRDAAKQAYQPTPEEIESGLVHEFVGIAPLYPQDPKSDPAPALAMPAGALRMIDRIETYSPVGGPQGLGFIRATKTVNPEEWFFKAHFYQDPVCPGSLGIDSFIQVLKFAALKRWPHLENSHRFGLWTGGDHTWIYRGQITPGNKLVTIEAVITDIQDGLTPCILADGYLKVDDLYIYQMKSFGIKLVPA
jgi:PfaB family protein